MRFRRALRNAQPAGALPALTVLLVPLACLAAPPADPIQLQADRLRSLGEREVQAEGDVVLRQGGLVIRADSLRYRRADDRAHAEGQVVVEHPGAVIRGAEVDLAVRDFSGWFIAPQFDFPALGTHGAASRIEFASRTRLTAFDARYTSCPIDAEPDWLLEADTVMLDMAANEGVAESAVLRFQGVPILALPRISFPVTDARKSGWLPPTFGLDSRSGLELSMPYYWNIAPNLDATLTPRVLTRRGFGGAAEYRYLMPAYAGEATVEGLPYDRVAGRERWALDWRHVHDLGAATVRVDSVVVSDDAWWKDFPQSTRGLTPRLLGSSLSVARPLSWLALEGAAYALVQHWQVLQDAAAPIVAPYARRPQIGLRGAGAAGPLTLGFETEFNRFVRGADDVSGPAAAQPLTGTRWHGIASVALPLATRGVALTPRLAVNAASYRWRDGAGDARREAARIIPTFSLDAQMAFERPLSLLGREFTQTLEPRLLYVNTPYHRQDELPNFDAYERDFNVSSIFATNAFSGVDRVSDSHQVTAGATSRLIDAESGAERARLTVVQRFLLRDQRVAANPDGSPDGPPLEQRFSDVLVLGSTTLYTDWALDAALQYSPDSGRLSRSVLGARWQPGPFRTVSARYRLARGLSEQLELGWQWPIHQSRGPGCSGTLYGVGRLNYSLRDSRLTDSIVGFEYDAGCWILRVVGERLSTGLSEAATRVQIQLELVGLSRLGSNPLQVLKDNIPGYQLLRDDRPRTPAVPGFE